MSKETRDIKIEKLGMEAKPYDKVLAKVAELCPAAVQNGKVDFERLKAELTDVVDENAHETYEFKWVGKNAAMVEANKPIRKTLRPCKEESKNWDATENLYIEGDNLDVLKLLEEGYLGKIKMIYIDPPYNTGSDSFVYRDNYLQSEEEMSESIGLFDEDNNRLLSTQLVRNTETNGRFHSRWCSMMYPCLKLARDLLTEDGVIFISIDDNEVANLKKICDEVFGEDNFVDCIIWNKRVPKNDNKGIGNIHEYILVYVKEHSYQRQFLMPKDGLNEIFEFIDGIKKKKLSIEEAEIELKKFYNKKGYDRGITLYNNLDDNYEPWGKINMSWPNGETFGPRYDVIHPITQKITKIPDRGWRWNQVTFNEQVNYNNVQKRYDGSLVCGNIWFAKDENTQPSSIKYLKDVSSMLLRSIISLKSDGGVEVENIFDGKSYFSYPKPTKLLKFLINSLEDKDGICLDFFSGSATTAHAVMQLNAEDGGNRKFIMVQLPEETDEKSEAYKNGYKNICEIGKERIRRAGDKIVQETGKTDLDIGFRVLKVDDSNMQDVYYKPSELKQADLLSSIDNIKADRTPLDLLFGVMVEWGVSLSLPLQEVKVGNNTIHIVGDNDLVACFDRNVSTATITKMAELNPTRVVFRDSCFEKDDEKINMFEIFKTICHWDDKQAKDNVRVM